MRLADANQEHYIFPVLRTDGGIGCFVYRGYRFAQPSVIASIKPRRANGSCTSFSRASHDINIYTTKAEHLPGFCYLLNGVNYSNFDQSVLRISPELANSVWNANAALSV